MKDCISIASGSVCYSYDHAPMDISSGSISLDNQTLWCKDHTDI